MIGTTTENEFLQHCLVVPHVSPEEDVRLSKVCTESHSKQHFTDEWIQHNINWLIDHIVILFPDKIVAHGGGIPFHINGYTWRAARFDHYYDKVWEKYVRVHRRNLHDCRHY